MKITREFLDQVIASTKCCLAKAVIKYHKRMKYGLECKGIQTEVLLLGRYLEILCEYKLEEETCECSFLGEWQLAQDGVPLNSRLIFYPGNIMRFYINPTTYIETTYEGSSTELKFTLEDGDISNTFEFKPINGESLFSPDCGKIVGYDAQVSPGVKASATMVDMDGEFSNVVVVYNGSIIYQATYTIDTTIVTPGPPNKTLQYFADEFNANNTAGLYMDTEGEQQGFVVYAANEGETPNGYQFLITNSNVTYTYVNLVMAGGENPVDAGIEMTLTQKNGSIGNCCQTKNCLTEEELENIINHINRICSIYKCP